MLLLAVVFTASLVVGCTRIGPGYVGIKINMSGSQRGVSEMPIRTGWVFYNPLTTKIFEFPVFMQTVSWTQNTSEGRKEDDSITFNDKDQVPISADVNLSYIMNQTQVPDFYVKFRSDDMDSFTYGYMRSVARNAFQDVASTYSFDQLNGTEKEQFLTAVKAEINKDINKYGVNIEQFGLIGALRPPANIAEAINMKTVAIQKALQTQNELQQAKAEALKVIAKAEGEAKANGILTKSISPELLKWYELQNQKLAIEKWNGARPLVEGANSGLLLQLGIHDRANAH